MDMILVSIIVAGALFFTIRSFVKIYKGEKKCACGGCKQECSSSIKDSCIQDFPVSGK